MKQRIIQFWRAVNASLNDKDIAFVNRYLNEKEQKLFFAMRIYDQRHALNVSYTACDLMKNRHVDEKLLLKACLLHDVGRTKRDICLLDKVFAVLLDKYLPKTARKLAKYEKTHRLSGRKDVMRYLFITIMPISERQCCKKSDLNRLLKL